MDQDWGWNWQSLKFISSILLKLHVYKVHPQYNTVYIQLHTKGRTTWRCNSYCPHANICCFKCCIACILFTVDILL